MLSSKVSSTKKVAPFTGAWIEIRKSSKSGRHNVRSLPSRERGLKFGICVLYRYSQPVAPFTGAWIEISLMVWASSTQQVAPFTGAWIEIWL